MGRDRTGVGTGWRTTGCFAIACTAVGLFDVDAGVDVGATYVGRRLAGVVTRGRDAGAVEEVPGTTVPGTGSGANVAGVGGARSG